MIDILQEELIIDDVLSDYGSFDKAGTYTSGQYELLVQALAIEMKTHTKT
jgi:hypothetical protein